MLFRSAAIIHLHARNPVDGSPTPDPDVFMQFLPRIKQASDAVVNITTGGGAGMSVAERLAAPQIGRASGRERVWQYVSVSVGAVAIQKKITTTPSKLWRRPILCK